MDHNLRAITEFVQSNQKALAAYVRQKLIAADAKPYLDGLGKDGIAVMDSEAAGVLLDLACALLRRLHPEQKFVAEEILAQLPGSVQHSIRLPRSEEYYAVLAQLPRASHPEEA